MNPDRYIIRPAQFEDYRGIASLEKECIPAPFNMDLHQIGYEIALPNRFALVAVPETRVNGQVVGYLFSALPSPRAPWIGLRVYRLGVTELWRRRGIGRDLLHHAYRAAIDVGGDTIHLEEVREINAAALALYRSEGFETVLERDRDRNGTLGKVYAMEKKLIVDPGHKGWP